MVAEYLETVVLGWNDISHKGQYYRNLLRFDTIKVIRNEVERLH